MDWTVPKMWPGATCYIIGGGPSLSDLTEEDFEIIKQKRTIATNNAYQLAPWSEFLYFMDHQWYKQHEVALASFKGIKVSIATQLKDRRDIRFLKRGSTTMLSLDSRILHNGNNSGYAAMNLAFLLGVTTIILVGFDMRVVDSQHNFHQQHTRKMKDDIYTRTYIPHFGTIKEPLEKNGCRVFNATPQSNLKCFPFIDLKETAKFS